MCAQRTDSRGVLDRRVATRLLRIAVHALPASPTFGGKANGNAEQLTSLTRNSRSIRDATHCLTPFGRATLADRYLLPGEGPQDLFARVARTYADDTAHAQRLYDYMSRLWFMPATPILSNGGTDRGLADLVLLERRRGRPREHRRHVVRERLARVERRRHRHVLGRRSLDRRARARLRAHVGDHSVRSRHGLADARDLAGIAAPRLRGRLHRRAPSRDRRVRRDPQTVGRLQPQEPELAPRRVHHGRVHARSCATTSRSRCAARTRASRCARCRRACSGSGCSRRDCRPASRTCCSSTPRIGSSRSTSAQSGSPCANRISAARSCCRPDATIWAEPARRSAASRP